MSSSGRTLIPSVSSSKNLSRPALAAGIGPWSCLRLRPLMVISLVDTLEWDISLFNVAQKPAQTIIKRHLSGIAGVYKSIDETAVFTRQTS